MLRRHRSSKNPARGTTRKPASAGTAQPVANWGRRLLVCLMIAVVVTVSIVIGRELLHSPKRVQTVIAKAAKNTSPEVSALLLEINDVVCELVEQYPDSPEAIDVMARLHQLFGETDEAQRYWKECLKIDPKFVPAYRSIGAVYLDLGEHVEAAKYFRKGLELEPHSAVLSVELSEALVGNGEFDEAIRILRKDIVIHPRSVASLAMLGHAYLDKRSFAQAREFFERAIEVGPNYTNAYFGLLTACTNLGDKEAAKKYAAKLKELKAHDEQSHRSALKVFDDIERVRGKVSLIYAEAGNVYLAHSDPVTAEAYYLKAVDKKPDAVRPREVLSWLYVQEGRTKEAVKMLAQLFKADPNDLSATMTCGSLYTQLNMFEEAEAAYRRAIQLTPEQAGGYGALSRLFVQAGIKNEEALSLAKKAVTLEPVAKYYFLLCHAYRANGKIVEARNAIVKAVDLDPTNTHYRRYLDLLEQR